MGNSSEAGIPGFHKWFAGTFPTAVTHAPQWQKESFDHVCIDMNQILHVALRRARNENQAFRQIFHEVNRTLKRLRPRQSVVFAFDGSAPLAKLLVQRQRRADTDRNSKYGMSALHLTPGTKFMEDVASAMEYYAFQECMRPCYRNVKFYISGANAPGEGELKCIDWLKRMPKGGSETAVIVGGDADLILQGLVLTELKDVFICSETDKNSLRLSSIWEMVRSLEEMFPGQSELVRIDLAVLMMMNGNDYLPKVRGVSFDICLRSYTSLKMGKHRNNFLIDGESRSVCWEFLVDLLAKMQRPGATTGQYREISLEQMDLNSRYSSAASWFHDVVQKRKLGPNVKIELHELFDSDSEDGSTIGWRSSTWVQGKEYSWISTEAKKQDAKHETAARLLEEFAPDEFEKFLENEKLRLLEQAQLDEENKGIDSDFQDASVSYRRAVKKRWFDVEEYLTGVLWNLQMYVDGFVPNYYWEYSRRYSPSVADILVWIQDNKASLAKVSSPVVRAPPLPAAIACLCMIPMTERGRAFLPERLQPLVRPGSPLLRSLECQVNIPEILRIVQEEAPYELQDFHDGSHRYLWKMVYLGLSAREGAPFPPPPPSKKFLPLEETKRMSSYMYQKVQATSVPGTSAPRNLPWSYPGDSSTPMSDILDQPYKKVFVGRLDEVRGGRGRVRGEGGGGRRDMGKSVAWRKETSGLRTRQSGSACSSEDAPRNHPRRAPAVEEGNVRPSPFPSSARSDTRSSMCFSSLATGRSQQCRLLL